MQTFDLLVRVGGHEYRSTWEDKPTTRKLKSGCPWKLQLADLDHIGKFCYLEEGINLPTDARQPAQIRAGQFYLYEDRCLILFTADCRTTYRYTYLGEILEPTNLVGYAGRSNVDLEIRPL